MRIRRDEHPTDQGANKQMKLLHILSVTSRQIEREGQKAKTGFQNMFVYLTG